MITDVGARPKLPSSARVADGVRLGLQPQDSQACLFRPAYLEFIAEGDSGIFIGQPGTRKNHVAKAIAYAAVRTGLRVAYIEADDFLGSLMELTAAEKRKDVQPVIDADLVVLDDLFLARQLPSESADTLQSIPHKRYKLCCSLFITSNRIIDDWHKFLGDAALATAILDRLLHRSVLVEFRGKSYRFKKAAKRLAKVTHSE